MKIVKNKFFEKKVHLSFKQSIIAVEIFFFDFKFGFKSDSLINFIKFKRNANLKLNRCYIEIKFIKF